MVGRLDKIEPISERLGLRLWKRIIEGSFLISKCPPKGQGLHVHFREMFIFVDAIHLIPTARLWEERDKARQ